MNTIYFNREVNNKKPSTIRNKRQLCPFCDTSQLANIVDQSGEFILVENKFSTLKDALMLVLIESSECKSNMHTYSLSHLTDLLSYALNAWNEYEQSGKYQSVALFKNKGLHSSGTISHPHMQIIGFKDQDIYSSIKLEHLEGHQVVIDDIEFNISNLPLISFLEFNIKLSDDINALAKTISFLTKFIEKTYWGAEASYNLFFYNIDGVRYLKIMPRYPTSAINIGYGIVQIYDQGLLEQYAQQLKDYYENVKESLQ